MEEPVAKDIVYAGKSHKVERRARSEHASSFELGVDGDEEGV